MARPTNTQRLTNIHSEALRDFDTIQSAARDQRLQCLDDRRFYSITGAQWEGPLGEQFQNKPRYEFNKCHLAVIRIINEYRNNRITVDFQAKDGTHDDKMADVCDGLYRADEQACTADEAYDNAFEEGTSGGFGAWRLRAHYEDEEDDENDQQTISIEPIFDADSTVFFDLDAKRQDKRDATRCYVLTPMTPEAYEAEWHDNPATWPRDIQRTQFDWCVPDLVWVCELYKIEDTKETVFFFRGLDEDADDLRVTQSELDADEKMLDQLLATGFRKVKEKRVTVKRVHKYIFSGGKVLEDCGLIAGRCIPIVPFFGKRWVIDGIERCMGHIRLAKDAQRLENMLMSWLAEMAARFDIEKPIFSQEQIAGHAQMWADDNWRKFPYLLANNMTGADGSVIPGSNVPVAYTKAPNIPPAMAALAQMATQALSDLLGNQQAGEQIQPNLSGKAVELIQNRLDMQVYIYMSNLAKAMKRCGEIWLSMKKDLVVEAGRKMKVITPDGKPGSVVMNQPAYDEKTSTAYIENDLSKASFDVVAEVGPSSTSQRQATVRALTGIASITDDPETKQALTLATIANLEGEGLGDLRDWARAKAIRIGILKPTKEEEKTLIEEQQAAQQQPPDAQTQYLLSAAQKQDADAKKSGAETVETLASAELKRAQTAKTIAETAGEEQSQLMGALDAVRSNMQPPESFTGL